MDAEAVAFQPGDDYLRSSTRRITTFFFHYNVTPLLVVETSQFDSDASDEALDDLINRSARWDRARGITCREPSRDSGLGARDSGLGALG